MHSTLLLVIVVATALAFDFTNGFHDTANVVASSISTRALAPRTAITLASILNFVGAFISLKVAATVATGIIEAGQVTEMIAFAGLLGAIIWNLVTWAYGLPSSSSHALIGGVIGAMLAAVGGGGVKVSGLLDKVIIPALIAPVAAFLAAGLTIVLIYRLFAHRPPGPVTRGFRAGQIVTSSLLSVAHGTNDAQKTMGVITLALVAHGTLSPKHVTVPVWVIICAASAISLGTYAGGWRIIRTVGSRIIRMDSAQGFSAQGAGAVVILLSSHLGYPLSSTHVISGGVIGAGAAKRLSAVRWGVAGNIIAAWVITLPAAGLFGAAAYAVASVFGHGATGPLLIALVALAVLTGSLAARRRRMTATASA
ncbi:MAG: inorganic phosphate transporter, PiT family [Solirubrobacteraceae bacterium]|jgi:PiT family inorganic phosphate transporter|nr:inorganic phosphate transporter, PiT family [Solirubrobacteraceae bacterium]